MQKLNKKKFIDFFQNVNQGFSLFSFFKSILMFLAFGLVLSNQYNVKLTFFLKIVLIIVSLIGFFFIYFLGKWWNDHLLSEQIEFSNKRNAVIQEIKKKI